MPNDSWFPPLSILHQRYFPGMSAAAGIPQPHASACLPPLDYRSQSTMPWCPIQAARRVPSPVPPTPFHAIGYRALHATAGGVRPLGLHGEGADLLGLADAEVADLSLVPGIREPVPALAGGG